MKKKYVGKLVDISHFDDPPQIGIILEEDDDFVPTMLTIYVFEDQRTYANMYTVEMVKFLEEQW